MCVCVGVCVYTTWKEYSPGETDIFLCNKYLKRKKNFDALQMDNHFSFQSMRFTNKNVYKFQSFIK